jgi:2-isopropylmalate synthase
MAIRTRQDVFSCDTNIDSTIIVPASRLVSSVTGFPVQPNKAIVGKNAFAHESGIHQDGVLKSRETYEIMRAQDVGWSDNKIVLGKHSGRNALKSRLEEIGIILDGEEALNAAFSRFKDVADRKHEIFDDDLIAIASESQAALEQTRYHLVSSWVCSETGEIPRAKVVLNVDGEELTGEAEGGGSVDAVFSAIKAIVKDHGTLELYSVNNITSGTDAQGEVTVRLERAGRQVYGNGSDPDIVIASAYSYIDALNKLAVNDSREHPQHSV